MLVGSWRVMRFVSPVTEKGFHDASDAPSLSPGFFACPAAWSWVGPSAVRQMERRLCAESAVAFLLRTGRGVMTRSARL